MLTDSEKRKDTYELAVGPLDDKFVLEHDEVPLTILVLHQALQSATEGVQQVAVADLHLVVGEESDPSETRDDADVLWRTWLVGGREEGKDGLQDGGLLFGRGADSFGGCAPPLETLSQEVLLLLLEEAHLHEDRDELGESLVPHGTSDDGLTLTLGVDTVPVSERHTVPVGVGNERVARCDIVRLGVRHEVTALHVDGLALGEEGSGVEEGQENTAR